MASEFDPALPSIRQIQTIIKQANTVELKLLSGDLLIGKIGWQDQNCLSLIDANHQTIIVWRHAIAYLKPNS